MAASAESADSAGGEEDTEKCTICLSEFEEDEDVRWVYKI